jgi:phage terminase small subunit
MPGRTGRRRHSEAEARFIGPKALGQHKRLYGERPPLPPLPDPPEWFTPSLAEIWQNTLAAAAPGALVALDYDNLTAYCVAAETYRRLAQRLTGSPDPPVELERRVRLAGAELGRASKALGILPADRVKIPAAPHQPEGPQSELMRFDMILPDGRRIPYTPPGKRRNTAQTS